MLLKDAPEDQRSTEEMLLAHYGRQMPIDYLETMLRVLGEHPVEQVSLALRAHVADTTPDRQGRPIGRFVPCYADLLAHMQRAEDVQRRTSLQRQVEDRYLESDEKAGKVLKEIGWREIVQRAGRNKRLLHQHVKNTLGLNFEKPGHCAAMNAAYGAWLDGARAEDGTPNLPQVLAAAREALQAYSQEHSR